jgi:glycosyltransferase involved in cell wall biosynthesis
MVLYPEPFDGRGPTATCAHLLAGFVAAGRDVRLFAGRFRMPAPSFRVSRAIPHVAGRAPYRLIGPAARNVAERRFLAAFREGDVAHLWPSASLTLHRELRARGAFIVQEAINSRMGHAAPILDAAYERLGVPPAHPITQARIDEEEEKYAMSDAIFCPSPMTEAALDGTGHAMVRISTSYGTFYSPDPTFERPDAGPDGRTVFLFVGYACIRKGIDRLLAVWGRLPPSFVLRVVGDVEPAVRSLFGDALDAANVETPGYSRDVQGEMARADAFVFLSIEEGDPQVTYEAANAGLPIVTTYAGGGRFLEEQDCAVDVTGMDEDALVATLLRIGRSREERMERGRAGRAAAPRYDWMAISARRSAALGRVTDPCPPRAAPPA